MGLEEGKRSSGEGEKDAIPVRELERSRSRSYLLNSRHPINARKMHVYEFKIDRFRETHPGTVPPQLSRLDPGDVTSTRDTVARVLGLPADTSPLQLVKYLDDYETIVPDVDATNPAFSLDELLRDENIVPKEFVLINWYRFDTLDRIRLDDLVRYFHEIWYPSSDDIDILDESVDWVVSVRHDGTIKVIRLNEQRPT